MLIRKASAADTHAMIPVMLLEAVQIEIPTWLIVLILIVLVLSVIACAAILVAIGWVGYRAARGHRAERIIAAVIAVLCVASLVLTQRVGLFSLVALLVGTAIGFVRNNEATAPDPTVPPFPPFPHAPSPPAGNDT